MVDDLLEPFRESPRLSGVFLDFDGTLSEIVERPGDARPVEGARELLEELGRKLGVVAVVSGRGAGELLEWFGPEIEIWGGYGSERVVDGHVLLSDLADEFGELMERVKEEAAVRVAAADLPGVVVENKLVLLNLHYRTAADRPKAVAALEHIADDLASEHGLSKAEGRLSIELRPPVDFTKAAVVLQRVRELSLRAAAFVGDDTVDLPAFDALDELAEEGVHTLRVAVDSEETPEELLARADIMVDGPSGVVSFIRQLT